MSLRKLNRSGRSTEHRRLRLALCSALLAGIAACAKVHAAEAAASSGAYSDSPAAVPAIQREGPLMIAHLEVLDSVDLRKLITGMKQGAYVIVLRHGATNANQADTDPLHLDNIASQRLLSAEGREVATRVGDFLPETRHTARESLFQRIQPGDGNREAREREERDDYSGPDRGRACRLAGRKRAARQGAKGDGDCRAGAGRQHPDRHSQAEHPRRIRQRLV